jgi:positive regulator of sigma E activity
MMIRTGRVESERNGIVSVRVNAAAFCGPCELTSGCWRGLLRSCTPQSIPRTTVIRARLPQSREASCAAGQQVSVKLDDSRLLGAAALAYGIPLLAIAAGALAAALLFPAPSDGAAAAGVLIGVASSALALRICDARFGREFLPRVEPGAADDTGSVRPR